MNCTDTLNNNGSSNITTFFLDDTAPNVTLYAPNNTILSSPNVTFSFNATDNFDTLMECMINLSGPSPRNVSINATRNANSSILVTNLSDGNYAWNVTCRDNINNAALSEMATFLH